MEEILKIVPIIVASEFTNKKQNSTGYYWSCIISILKSKGFKIKVITPKAFCKITSLQMQANKILKMFWQISISLKMAFLLLQDCKKSIILTGTNPALFLSLMPFIKAFKRRRWVLLVHDLFPFNLVPAQIISQNSLLYFILVKYFTWVYKTPDKIICIGRDMKKKLENITQQKSKIVFVPNWADESVVVQSTKKNKNHSTIKKVCFQFFGNMGLVQGIDNLLNAIALVTAKNAVFQFLGYGAKAQKVLEFKINNPSKQIFFIKRPVFNKKYKYLKMCDVSLISLNSGMLGLGVPSKAYFSLAAGKPLLASVDRNSEVGLMIKESPVGWRCDAGNPVQLAKKIDIICANPNIIKKKSPKKTFLKKYSKKIVLKKLFHEIVKS